jgi:hypothetical protein
MPNGFYGVFQRNGALLCRFRSKSGEHAFPPGHAHIRLSPRQCRFGRPPKQCIKGRHYRREGHNPDFAYSRPLARRNTFVIHVSHSSRSTEFGRSVQDVWAIRQKIEHPPDKVGFDCFDAETPISRLLSSFRRRHPQDSARFPDAFRPRPSGPTGPTFPLTPRIRMSPSSFFMKSTHPRRSDSFSSSSARSDRLTVR